MSKLAIQSMPLRWTPRMMVFSIGLVFSIAGSGAVCAFEFAPENGDIKMRWDNQVRYNAGWRMGSVSPAFANSPGTDETELKFKRGDLVTNRLDIFSEFDFVYKKDLGFRISGALWEDWAYRDKSSVSNPALFAAYPGYAYTNHRFNDYGKRYIAGPSGEILDAFAFGTFDLGSNALQVKLGQHNVYWGESVFAATNGIAYSQGPIDTIKAATSPGAEAKELFMPLKQFSAQMSLTNKLSLIGQYQFDWKALRMVPGGTYFSVGDGGRSEFAANACGFAVGASCFFPLNIPNGGDIGPDKKRGAWGLALRWNPEWLGGTLGAYYRKFDETIPWAITTFNGPLPTAVRLSFARDTELYGLSLNKSVGKVSLGAELAYRKNAGLASIPGFAVVPAAGAEPTYEQAEGARGNTWHALLNGVLLLDKTRLWEGGTLIGELSYQSLDRITKNGNLYWGEGTAACTVAPGVSGRNAGCSTKRALVASVMFAPEWPQIFPSWDLAMPATYNTGLRGNSPALGSAGLNERAYNWSLGVKATYLFRHEFSLTYIQPTRINYATGADPITGLTTATTQNGPSGAGGVQNSHAWLSFSYKTSF